MRITFALPPLHGTAGGMRVAAQYAAHLQHQGHDVTLALRRPEGIVGPRRRLLRALRLARTQPLRPGRGHFEGLALPILHLPEHRALRPADLPDADVLVSTWWTTTEWAARMPASKGVQVHLIQDHEVFEPSVAARVRTVYRQPMHKVVVAGWLQQTMADLYHRPSVVVANGVDIDQFTCPRPRHRGAVPRLGFLHSMHPRKNSALAMEVLAHLRRRMEIRGLAFGTGERPEALPPWVDYERNPSQTRIPQIYAACDAWLFTSTSEGFGLPVLEAMACGTPVIATPAGAAPDLVDGSNGRLVSAATPEALADAAQDLLEGDWTATSASARATAERHSLPQAAAAFEAALIDALAVRGAAGQGANARRRDSRA